MDKDAVLARLKAAEPDLRAKGVARAALFSSVARDEQRPDSDITVELDPAAHLGLWEYVGIINLIEDMFPVKVDVSDREMLRPFVRPSAERDAIHAF